MEYDFTWNAWLMLIFASVLIGVSKIGFSGLSLLSVSIFAQYFGLQSVGVLLPLLLLADLIVYPVMRRHGEWKEIWPLLPPALLGMGLGYFALSRISEQQASRIIGLLILLMLLFLLVQRAAPHLISAASSPRAARLTTGLIGGVATALANAAGPILKIYLLSQKHPKLKLVGLSARFFLLLNALKIPFLGGMNFITPSTLRLNAVFALFIPLGIFVGKGLLTRVPQLWFERLVLVSAFIAACQLLF